MVAILTRKRVIDAESWSVKDENSSGVWTLTTIWSIARIGRLSDPSLVRDRASASFEDTVALVNPAGVDVFTHDFGRDGVPAAYYFGGLCAAVDDDDVLL